MSFQNKLVIIINKDIELGVAMNAVAHSSLALGAVIGKDDLFLQEYKDASGNNWPISGMPYIVLKGKSNEIKKALVSAKEQGLFNLAFTETMTGGSYEEQIVRTSLVKEEDHVYYSGVLFGEWDKVSQITKKFSLFK